MITLSVRHSTIYRYATPVTLGEHRLMLRPRDSHDLRLVDTELVLSPRGEIRWMHDVFGNSVAVVRFAEPAAELHIESVLKVERYGGGAVSYGVLPEARTYPFIYSADDRTDLGRLLDLHQPDPRGMVAAWAKSFVPEGGIETLDLLSTINATIRQRFAYTVRTEEGTQSAQETLERGSGSCRDFAQLMIEAVRCLGLGARFVTGYLYDPTLDGGEGPVQGAGATHAWLEVYLPGAGWVEFDPTNAMIGSDALLRVAVAREPSQAVPVSGSFTGRPGDSLGMSVEVTVTAQR